MSDPVRGWAEGAIFLAVDTCGATGSVALGRVAGESIVTVGEAAISAGANSANLLPAIAELLSDSAVTVADLSGITVVSGPGSFTGIRVGLAAVKAIAEAAKLPVLAISRLALLAHQAQAPSAVLDAHRGQVFYGSFGGGQAFEERLLTAGEINAAGGLSGRVAVCEESVAQMLEELRGEPELVRVAPPTAAAALKFSASRWQAGETADIASLDGHYLRGADAKIAGHAG